MIINVFLMAGAVQAFLQHRKVMYDAIKAPTAVFALDARGNTDTDPCAIISKAFEAVPGDIGSTKPIILDVRPSVGTACHRSVPLTKDRNLALLDYLQPYIEYQSTIELLKHPPPEYLLPGVDVMGGMQAIRQKLENDGYQSQLDVMTDLQNIFVAANDNHFGYTPGLFTAFRYARPGLKLVSISTDGLDMPEVFAAQDIFAAENGTYPPSPIATIDSQDVYDFLENEAIRIPQGHQDPDARLNSLFHSVPATAAGGSGLALLSMFEIPDNYTIVHKNGTSRVVINSIVTLPRMNLSGIRSGRDFQSRFEIPPRKKAKPETPPLQPPPPPSKPTLPGYPLPLVKHSSGNVASYILNDTELRDTTVISFLSFRFLTKDILSRDFNLNSFVREFGDVIDRTATAAREQGRDKLIIDMSANFGGILDLVDVAYTIFFPGARFDSFDRYRVNSGLDFLGRVLNYNESLKFLVGREGLPTAPNNQTISPDAFFAPNPVKGQNMTAAFHIDVPARYLVDPDVFLRGCGQNQACKVSNREALWKPENIVILTDGLCASACSIFTGLLVRNFGIRTIALGGRPMNKPMQAIGGVKGSQVFSSAVIQLLTTMSVEEAKRSPESRQLLQEAARFIPDIQDPPLLPFMEDGAGSVNSRNAYSQDDTEGFPLHFKYEAANCRLFYTRNMVMDVTESWRQAARIAFMNGTCVPGSTVNQDGTMGATALGFHPDVRGRAPGISRPTLCG